VDAWTGNGIVGGGGVRGGIFAGATSQSGGPDEGAAIRVVGRLILLRPASPGC
jgi:hypothetical protein